MRLLLVRHGETVDNVAHRLAGITDSALTNHGKQQIDRLGKSLKGIEISQIYSSDLQRAFLTAEAIRLAQDAATRPAQTIQLKILREQDMGSDEGKTYGKIPPTAETPSIEKESRASLIARAEEFVASVLAIHVAKELASSTTVIVAHGIILGYLYRAIHNFCKATASPPDIVEWSNTGYMDLMISGASPSIRRLTIQGRNCLAHLNGLKRTGGGIGSAKYDGKQKSLGHFLVKKRKSDDGKEESLEKRSKS
jgi:broad specificity phosphatase PhoE